MDCDGPLVLEDMTALWALCDDSFAVQVVQHDHRPKEETKFLNQPQTSYEKKNWSSVMLFNCAKCSALTPEYVNQASGLELHRFQWLESEDLNRRNPSPVEPILSTTTQNDRPRRYPTCTSPPAVRISKNIRIVAMYRSWRIRYITPARSSETNSEPSQSSLMSTGRPQAVPS